MVLLAMLVDMQRVLDGFVTILRASASVWRAINVSRALNVCSYLLSQDFVHPEHVYFFHSKDRFETRIAQYFTFILGVLQLVAFDVLPKMFHHLWTGHLIHVEKGS
jgi:hypothetical protein